MQGYFCFRGSTLFKNSVPVWLLIVTEHQQVFIPCAHIAVQHDHTNCTVLVHFIQRFNV